MEFLLILIAITYDGQFVSSCLKEFYPFPIKHYRFRHKALHGGRHSQQDGVRRLMTRTYPANIKTHQARIKAQRAKVKQASEDIDKFCDETGRARRRNREYTPVNATWPDKQPIANEVFTSKQGNGIIETRKSRDSVTGSLQSKRKHEKLKELGQAVSMPVETAEAVKSFRRIGDEHTRKQDIERTNPHYLDGPEWQNNCQRCVPAYKARRRGYNVTAQPLYGKPIDDGYVRSAAETFDGQPGMGADPAQEWM